MQLPAFMVQVGDLVDLQGDRLADPNSTHVAFQHEYQQVVEIEIEDHVDADGKVWKDGCIAIGFEGFDVVGFPRNHVLKVFERDGAAR